VPVAKWPFLEADMKNWITDHKNNRISVPTKMMSFKVRECAVAGIIHETVWTVKHRTLVLKILYCLKKVTAWTVAMVMMSMIVRALIV
jgi:hypothetical protein